MIRSPQDESSREKLPHWPCYVSEALAGFHSCFATLAMCLKSDVFRSCWYSSEARSFPSCCCGSERSWSQKFSVTVACCASERSWSFHSCWAMLLKILRSELPQLLLHVSKGSAVRGCGRLNNLDTLVWLFSSTGQLFVVSWVNVATTVQIAVVPVISFRA